MAIPRLIHQTAPDFDSLPYPVRASIDRMRNANPGWEYRFYNDAAQRAFLNDHLEPEIASLLDRVNPRYGVVLADLFKYLIIQLEGGVYLDIKSTATVPFDEVLLADDSFLISQWRNRLFQPYSLWGKARELKHIRGGEFQQWFIVAEPGHPFLKQVVANVGRNMACYSPARNGAGKRAILRLSGPVCFTLAIEPMLKLYPHRRVDIEDLGFRYSLYPSKYAHMREPDHYARFREPVMTSD